MSQLFNKDMTKRLHGVSDWKQVVHEGVKILVEFGYSKQSLEDAILESTKKFGAYYVLERGLAFLHAPVGDYSLKTGASVMILDDFVRFNEQEGKEAKIIITLSATDSNSHLSLLMELSNYFQNEEFKKEAYKVDTVDALMSLIEKYKSN
ncbi:PTS sugar transporter subunit IIA [Mycoplasmopsis caviae]|uniref:Ascorbate-specific PTS system EIIA component n=1 Tax=Mycoplasmopsis caviae TaxID=55603 RepID=A0A3P8KB41_9BACT|nr:PTS sugar transporter subunit IIA [Mycoplasmopsis caviae]UUD35429.1 PTS sugar transporter subunit IIA [Mycoplasmopsis caviae]VDR41794.1 ascorbate-specific PTS system enzyme II Ccomponent [Mycoplasmopsis caviae]